MPATKAERKTSQVPRFNATKKMETEQNAVNAVIEFVETVYDDMKLHYFAGAAVVAGAVTGGGIGVVHDRAASSHILRMTFVVPAPLASSETNFFATRSLLLLSLSSN